MEFLIYRRDIATTRDADDNTKFWGGLAAGVLLARAGGNKPALNAPEIERQIIESWVKELPKRDGRIGEGPSISAASIQFMGELLPFDAPNQAEEARIRAEFANHPLNLLDQAWRRHHPTTKDPALEAKIENWDGAYKRICTLPSGQSTFDEVRAFCAQRLVDHQIQALKQERFNLLVKTEVVKDLTPEYRKLWKEALCDAFYFNEAHYFEPLFAEVNRVDADLASID